MLTKIKSRKEDGFTIVEVLIVLAIAALILIIVLIAVPDLQRSARNTNIEHDAQNIASGIQTYEGDNDGGVPSTVALSSVGSDVVDIKGATGSTTTTATAHVQASDTIVDVQTGSPAYADPGVTSTSIGPGMIQIDEGYECGTSGNAGAANARAVAVYYPIEGSGTGSVKCIQE